MATANRDAEVAAAYDADPSLLEPSAYEVKRRRPTGAAPLATAVPVRFSEDTIAAVKLWAEHDGLTVSRWIRGVVDGELERRRQLSDGDNVVQINSYRSSEDLAELGRNLRAIHG